MLRLFSSCDRLRHFDSHCRSYAIHRVQTQPSDKRWHIFGTILSGHCSLTTPKQSVDRQCTRAFGREESQASPPSSPFERRCTHTRWNTLHMSFCCSCCVCQQSWESSPIQGMKEEKLAPLLRACCNEVCRNQKHEIKKDISRLFRLKLLLP